MDPGRLATLVVVDSQGNLRGATSPIPISLPWWPDTGPIVDAVPGSVVLRLLDAVPDEEAREGGRVTYLIQNDANLDVELAPWTGDLGPDPLRQPWAEVGGPDADFDWVRSQVDITGTPRQHRT